ncbi:morphogenic membrane protein MmpA [Streptomyces sp. NPDC002580]|uniref:morphogenic membrane protein MmpA n=1 Tax=Streptomyces sp. NPDC002580 TaxID=3364653 RepID=UPI003690DF47
MTTHRAPNGAAGLARPVAAPARPSERAVTAALLVAASAGLAWIGGMVCTVVGWVS